MTPAQSAHSAAACEVRAHGVTSRLRWAVHNLIAHPLLVLAPPLGERLHDWTAP